MLKPTSDYLRQLGFTGPGILINEDQARANIRTMAQKARLAGVGFRPHFKTHQSADVARWFADEAVRAITVSSVTMAEYFAAHGWHDITIAFLLNPLQWPRLEDLARRLAGRGGSLAVTVDSAFMAADIAQRPDLPLGVWIKVDAGYGRTGVSWQDKDLLQTIVDLLADGGRLRGLLTHSGESYHAETPNSLALVWARTVQRLESMTQGIASAGDLLFSVGDTPCCRFLDDLSGVQEIRPGNFVFFDLMQYCRGICLEGELAAAVVCPVVGLYPDRNRIVVHGGAVHFSREYLTGVEDKPFFGLLGTLTPGSGSKKGKAAAMEQRVLTEVAVTSVCQEHGTIEVSSQLFQEYFGRLEIGDLVLVWPVHSCLACNLAGEYRTMAGVILDNNN